MSLADDLYKPNTQASLDKIRGGLELWARRVEEQRKIDALKKYREGGQAQTTLTPEAQQGVDATQNAGEIPVEPKVMPNNFSGPPKVPYGEEFGTPTAEAPVSPSQTRVQRERRRISDATPEELNSFGESSGDILSQLSGQEAAQAKSQMEIEQEKQKQAAETSRQLSVEKLKGENDVRTQQTRNAGTRGTKTFQDYLDANDGDYAKAQKAMQSDRLKMKATGPPRAGSAKDRGEYLFTKEDQDENGKGNGVFMDYYGIPGQGDQEDKILRASPHPQKKQATPGSKKLNDAEKMKLFMDKLGGAKSDSTQAPSAQAPVQAEAPKPRVMMNSKTGEKVQYNDKTGQWEKIQK